MASEPPMLRVRTLQGKCLQYPLQPGDTVGSFCKRVQLEGGPDLSACKLFCNGTTLSKKQLLGTLGLGPNGFLVAVPDTSRKGRHRRPAQPETAAGGGGDAGADGATATAVAESSPRAEHAFAATTGGFIKPSLPGSPTGGKLDTLLPGYHLRPSPSKRARPPLPPFPAPATQPLASLQGLQQGQRQQQGQAQGPGVGSPQVSEPWLQHDEQRLQGVETKQQGQQFAAPAGVEQLDSPTHACMNTSMLPQPLPARHSAAVPAVPAASHRVSSHDGAAALDKVAASQAVHNWRQLLDAVRAQVGAGAGSGGASRKASAGNSRSRRKGCADTKEEAVRGQRGRTRAQGVRQQEEAAAGQQQRRGQAEQQQLSGGRKRRAAGAARAGQGSSDREGTGGAAGKRQRRGGRSHAAAGETAVQQAVPQVAGIVAEGASARPSKGPQEDGKANAKGRGRHNKVADDGEGDGRTARASGKRWDGTGSGDAGVTDERVRVCLAWLKEQDRVLEKLPLPECLQRLQRWLVVLVQFHTMMQRHHAHLTWDVLARGLYGDGQEVPLTGQASQPSGLDQGQGLAGERQQDGQQTGGRIRAESPLQPADILHMASLAPSLLSVHDPRYAAQGPGAAAAPAVNGAGEDTAQQRQGLQGAVQPAASLAGKAAQAAVAGLRAGGDGGRGGGGGSGDHVFPGSGCIEADVMAYGWSQAVADQVARPQPGAHSEGLGTRRAAQHSARSGAGQGGAAVAGKGLEQAQRRGDEEGWDTVLELSDPGRLEVDSSLLERCTTPDGQLPQPPQVPLELLPPVLQQRRGAQGVGRVGRFSTAFRRCLVAAVLQLHNEFMERRAQTAATVDRPMGSSLVAAGCNTSRGTGQQDEDSGAQCDQQVGAVSGEGGEHGGSGGCEDWDPLSRGAWHPLFPLSTITTAEVAEAARRVSAAVAAMAGASDGEEAGGREEGADGNGKAHNHASRPPRTVRPRSSAARPTRCSSTQALGPLELLEHLQELGWYKGQLQHKQDVPARPARFATPTVPLGPAVQRVLDARGTQQMFIHQAQAIDSIMRGQPTVIATSTASGKSLCFQVPIIATMESDPMATALLMFPTKALAQDQKASLCGMLSAAFGPEAAEWADTYDGDTARFERDEVRSRCRLLITNPDMLHCSVLPAHTMFVHLLSGLRYVVLDEGHSYYGAFGAHTAMVVRRLRRLCRQYGSNPTFVVASATIANPGQHAQLLLGMDKVTVVDDDGSPHGPKSFVLWNPPLTFVPSSKKVEQRWVLGPVSLEEARAGTASQQDGAGRGQRGRKGKQAQAQRLLGLWQEMGGQAQQDQTGQCQDGRQEGHDQVDPVQQSPAGQAAGGKGSARKQAKAGTTCELRVTVDDDGSLCADSGSLATKIAQAQAAISAVAAAVPGTCPAPTGGGVGGAGRIAGCADDTEEDGGGSQLGGMQADPDHGLWLLTASGYIKLPPGGVAQRRGGAAGYRGQASGVHMAGAGHAGGGAAGGAAGVTGGRKRPAAAEAAEQLQNLRLMAMKRFPGRTNWRRMVAEQKAKAQMVGQAQVSEQRRASPIVEISLLLAECIQHRLRTIAFCKSRKLSELVATYTRELLKANAPELVDRLKVYRGGYSPAERRAIEAELFNGQLLGVAATNALELGVDVGSLDVTLHLGFPGSVSSLRQQAGRAGRREQQSLAVFVAFDGPLDQHFMRNPDHLLRRPVESVQLDPHNTAILAQHVLCAAAELPLTLYAPGQEPSMLHCTPDPGLIAGGFAAAHQPQVLSDGDRFLFGPGMEAVVAQLKVKGILGPHPHSFAHDLSAGTGGSSASVEVLHYTGTEERVSRGITLRSIDPEHFVIVDETRNLVLEQVEARMAFFQVYDGAVYMHQGRTYLCSHLDLGTRVAKVRPADIKYYTRVRDMADIHVTGGRIAYPVPAVLPTCKHFKPQEKSTGCGPLPSQVPVCSCCRPCTSATVETAVVTIRWLGYTRVWQGTGQVMDVVDLHLPDFMFETQATYLRVPRSARVEAETLGLDFRAGLHAAGHALLNVLPLFLICNPKDVGTECDHPLATRFRIERLLLYDKQHAGGVGLAAQAAPLFHLLIEHALRLVAECACDEPKGCPCCIHHSDCPNYNVLLCKRGAEIVLRHTLEAEMQAMGINNKTAAGAHADVQDNDSVQADARMAAAV